MASFGPRKIGALLLLLLRPALAGWMGFGFPRYANSDEHAHTPARDDVWHPHLNLFEDGMLNIVFSCDKTYGWVPQEWMGPFKFCEPMPNSYLCDGDNPPSDIIDTSQDEPLGTKYMRKIYFESSTWMEPGMMHIGSKRRWAVHINETEIDKARPNYPHPGEGWVFYKFSWLPDPDAVLGIHCGNYCTSGPGSIPWWEPFVFDNLWVTWRGRFYNVPEHCNVIWRDIVNSWYLGPRYAHRAHCVLPIRQDANETGSKVWKCEELGKCYVAERIDKYED